MQELVFVQNGRLVTDSLTVAQEFEKSHDKVLRDIRELGCSDEFRLSNFGESSYTNSQGRQMPAVVLTEQGLVLLVMGYTGVRAMEMKERYIAEFERMRQTLKEQQADVVPLSKDQALVTLLRTTADLVEDTAEIKQMVNQQSERINLVEAKVDEQITLDSGEQRRLQKAVSRRVYELEQEPLKRPQMYSSLYREIKDRWAVPSYKDVRRTELSEVLQYVQAWKPRIA